MPRNVFIIGPHCTGKTTLLNALAEHYTKRANSSIVPAIIQEQVREIMHNHNFSTNDFGTERWISLQQRTIEAQIQAEESLVDQWFISDRSVLDPIVYAQMTPKLLHHFRETDGWNAALERMKEGIVVICEAGQKSWQSCDAVRVKIVDDQQWQEMNSQFEELAKEEGVSYHLLSKDTVSKEDRLKFVLDLLAQRPEDQLSC